MIDTSRENRVTQEYFADNYQATVTDQGFEDCLTDDDIAVFRSQLNDIPTDLALHPVCRKFNTNVQLLLMRHQSQFIVSIDEEDPIRRISAKSNSKRKRSRGASLSTY